jgi:hypothetical protein
MDAPLRFISVVGDWLANTDIRAATV